MASNWKKRLTSAVATGALIASMLPVSALAEGALTLDSTATTAEPAGPGYSLTVSGLDQGDTATYYKIIEQDTSTGKWKLTTAVDKATQDGIVDGTENVDFGHKDAEGNTVLGLFVDELVISNYTVGDDEITSDTRQITAKMANAISAAVTNNQAPATGSGLTANADGAVTVANAAAGMYMFVAVPKAGNTDYIYKPVFVSCDYYNSVSTPEDNTHQIELEEGVTDYLGNEGVFKRSPLAIDKKSGTYDEDGNPIDMQNDVAVGDLIDFTITVPIPAYTQNYVAPMFYITDVLTDGLELQADSITVSVKNGDETVSVAQDKDYKVYVKPAATDENAIDYYDFKNTEPVDSTLDGFVVQFLSDDPTTTATKDGFLYTKTLGGPTATITYKAKVVTTDTQLFAQQVNQMDNTAKLNFSQNPNYVPDGYFKDDGTPDEEFPTDKPDTTDESGEEEDTGELEDKTRHYTFDIDADVLGRDQSGDVGPGGEPVEDEDHDRTSEIRKIWLDANGEVIQTRETGKVVKDGEEAEGKEGEYGWLEGAEFELKQVQAHNTVGANTTEKFEELETPVTIKFDGNHIRVATGGSNPKSDGKGYIAMKGLDAGVYELKEIAAPLGYAFNPNVVYTITITPNYVLEAADNADGVTPPQNGTGGADDLILESYTVQIRAPKLDDNLNIIEGEYVDTICTYNIKKTDGVPDSMLNDDGTQNTDTTIDTTVEAFGNNTTAMVPNKRLGVLPATGGSGILFYLGVGGAIALISYILMDKVKKASNVTAA